MLSYRDRTLIIFSSVCVCIVCALHRDAFEDEITDELKHTGAGILSMANRQVYI